MATKTTRKFEKIRSKNEDLNRVQDNIEKQYNQVVDKEVLDGHILQNVTLVPNKVNLVQHKLGRQIEGWIVIRKRADARIWDVQDCNVNKQISIALIVTSEVEVDLWVF